MVTDERRRELRAVNRLGDASVDVTGMSEP
jgi:hypothetical protein